MSMETELLESDVAEYARDGVIYIFRRGLYFARNRSSLFELAAFGESEEIFEWDIETE